MSTHCGRLDGGSRTLKVAVFLLNRFHPIYPKELLTLHLVEAALG